MVRGNTLIPQRDWHIVWWIKQKVLKQKLKFFLLSQLHTPGHSPCKASENVGTLFRHLQKLSHKAEQFRHQTGAEGGDFRNCMRIWQSPPIHGCCSCRGKKTFKVVTLHLFSYLAYMKNVENMFKKINERNPPRVKSSLCLKQLPRNDVLNFVFWTNYAFGNWIQMNHHRTINRNRPFLYIKKSLHWNNFILKKWSLKNKNEYKMF